jgi:hypothetical protein
MPEIQPSPSRSEASARKKVDVVRDWDLVSVPHSTPRHKTFKTYLNILKQRIEREPGTRLPEIDSKGKSAPIYASFLTSSGYGSSLLAKYSRWPACYIFQNES